MLLGDTLNFLLGEREFILPACCLQHHFLCIDIWPYLPPFILCRTHLGRCVYLVHVCRHVATEKDILYMTDIL